MKEGRTGGGGVEECVCGGGVWGGGAEDMIMLVCLQPRFLSKQ